MEENYTVKTKGITIGNLDWQVKLKKDIYTTSINLKNRGPLSLVYKFKGYYKASGIIKKDILISEKYIQEWKTKNKQRNINLIFENNKIIDLKIKPEEKELARINFLELEGYSDPLTSFLNIFLNNLDSKTIDGRRAYVLSPERKNGYTKVLIKNYINIWADHNKNDLEYLEIFQNSNEDLPYKINIKFKGSVFTIKKL
ncbi:DUF3108 domain-containing protein [Alphaproteobacteria bacterium]|nr:DUF3108 domain-containing protein [Alphaproteobacteria bacterium]